MRFFPKAVKGLWRMKKLFQFHEILEIRELNPQNNMQSNKRQLKRTYNEFAKILL